MRDLVVVFRTPSPSEAEVVRGLLETHGIEAIIGSDLSRTAFPLSLNELRIAVQADDCGGVAACGGGLSSGARTGEQERR